MTEDISRTKRDEVKTDGASQSARFTKHYQNEQSKNDKMCEVRSTHCKDGECMQNYRPEMARPRSRRGDNIKTNLTQTERNGVVWIHLAQDFIQWRVVLKTAMNLRVPLNVRNFFTSWATISFSRSILFYLVTCVVQSGDWGRYELLRNAGKERPSNISMM
jgi:hypothetical protein